MAGIVLAWYYVVAPATTVQEPNGRWVTWPPVLEGPYIEETTCRQRAEQLRERRGVPAHCERSEVLRELRR
ncbi:MAG TPA: hypothetical protein VFE48_19825 [Methylomirabilota bacterium]|nr:hypothetical protein [Methylomirabilota bacterium]